MSSNSLTPQFDIVDQDFSSSPQPSAPAPRPRRLQAQALSPKFEVVDAPEPQFEVVDPPPVTMNQKRGNYTGPTLNAEDTVPAFGSKAYLKAIPGAVAESARATWQDRPANWREAQRAAVGGLTDVATGAGMPGNMASPPLGGQMVKHVEEMETPGKRATGALGAAATATEALTPLMGPAALENPGSILRGLAEGTAASEAGGYALKKAGVSDENVENAKSLLFWAPGVGRAVIDPRVAVAINPEEVRLGVAANPLGRGPIGASVSIPRGPRPAPAGPTGIEPPTIEGNPQPLAPPPDDAAQKLIEHATVMQNAEKVVNGEPIAPPEPPPPAVHEIGTEQIQEIGGMLSKLPENVRAQAIIETHGTLSKLLMQQGKIVANGKLEVIKTPEQADSVAQRLINDEIGRRDKEAEDAAKEAAKPEKPAARSGESQPTGTKVSSRQKAAELAQPKFEVLEPPAPAPTPKFEVVDAEAPKVESGNGREGNVPEGGTLSVERSGHAEISGQPERNPEPSVAGGAQAAPSEVHGNAGEPPIHIGSGTGAPTAGESGDLLSKPFAKGDSVAFSKNFQIPKGNGQSEIIRLGTKAAVEYVNPDMKFARVRTDDGKVNTVPFKYLEGVNGNAEQVQPAKQSSGTVSTGEVSGANGEGIRPNVAAGDRGHDAISGAGDQSGQRQSGALDASAEKQKPAVEKKPVTPQVESGTKYVLPSFVTSGLSKGATEKPAEESSEKKGAQSLAQAVYEKLKAGESLGNVTDLNALAEKHFGAARTAGTWTPKDAFDAMEAGVNKHLLDIGKDLMEKPAEEGLAKLRELMPRITSQAVRTEDQIKNQQFSTPPTESYVVAKVAALKPSDVVLEPSAGNGGLAVWPQAIGAETHVNEIAPRRQEMLKEVGFSKPTAHDGEIINSLLDKSVKPSVVIMNPPFSAGTVKSGEAKNDNKYGFNHVDSALQRLEPNGRLVAILGGGHQGFNSSEGASLTGAGSGKWFERIAEKYNVRANIRVSGKEYQKYGTGFATRIIVIDKDGPTPSRVKPGAVKTWDSVKQGNVDTLEQAYNLLKEVAESRPNVATGREVEAGTRNAESGNLSGAREGQPQTGLAPTPGSDLAGNREPVRAERAAGKENELAGRPEGTGSVSREPGPGGSPERSAVRESEVRSAGHPEAGSPEGARGGNEVAPGGGPLPSPAEQHLDGTETPDAGLSLGRENPNLVPEESDSEAYVNYRPTIKGPSHPGAIVETATMATVPMPEISYKPKLPESVIKEGKLSAVQLEAISIAGQQNEIILPNGARASALIGDGTGVGKGRIAAGTLWDNWRQGRKRLVWVSEKWDLMQDALRDLKGIGADELAKTIKPFGKFDAKQPIEHEGVLFSTYALIRSADKKGNTRVSQLAQWLKGKDDADGAYILYDESHNLKNAVAAQGAEVSQIGKAVKDDIMGKLPKLRSVSLSATAATDVMNLGYLDRLGIWGAGTAFPNGFQQFANEISSGGMSAMEMVARELKAQGKYVSRTLSFKGVTYREVEHPLNDDQKEIYRSAAKAWKQVSQRMEDTIKNTTNGGAMQKGRAMSQFYSAQQRFFNVLITTLKVPSAIKEARAALANDKSVVITLVNTNEAAQNREKNRYRDSDDADETPDYDFGPKEMLMDMVREHYPTQQFRDDVDSAGNPIKVPVTRTDTDGREIAVENPEAVKERDALLKELDKNLKMPENPLDSLVNGLGGQSKVAELTGRKERYDAGTGKFVPRGGPDVKRDEINLSEMRAFQAGKKRIAILSSAAGTGISLHAGNDVANQQPRVHVTLQVGWSADKQMQMFGRTHRTNQAHPPEYVMLTSDLGGEKRFVSTIARRLGSLGALSKGQKNANAGSDLMEKVNFETDQGRQATNAFYTKLLRNQPIPGTDLTGMQVLTDMGVLKSAAGGGLTVPAADRTNVTRLLNRVLALDPDVQNAVYNYFYDIFQATVQQAIEDGTLDTGVKTMPGDEFHIKEEKPIAKDPKTQAETFYYPVEASVRTERLSPAKMSDLVKKFKSKNARIIYRAPQKPVAGGYPSQHPSEEEKTAKVAIIHDANPIVHADGSVTQASYIAFPDRGKFVKVANSSLSRWKPVKEHAEEEYQAAQDKLESAKKNLEYAQETARRYPDEWAQRRLAETQRTIEEAEKNLAEPKKIADDSMGWATDLWQEQYEKAPSHTVSTHHLIGGAVMKYWNGIRDASGQHLDIYTATDSKSGKRIVGVDIPGNRINQLLDRIGGGKSTVNAAQMQTDVLKNGLTYDLEGGIQVKPGRVAREKVVQFIPPSDDVAANLKRMGVIYEKGLTPVYYLPTGEGRQERDRAEGILEKVLKEYPVTESGKPETEKEPASELNLKAGDVVTFSKIPPGSYLTADEPFKVESVDKKGNVQFRNERTGGATSENRNMLALSEYKKRRSSEAGFATPGMLVPEKLINAGEKVFEAAARAYDHLTEPPKWEGIQALTRKWTGAENYNAWELEQFTKAIKESVPSKLKREALSNWIEAGGDEKILKRWADQSKLAYKKGYEAALDLTPEEEDVGRAIIRLHNEILEKAQEAGIVDEGVENYIQHIWEKEPQAARKILAQINFAGLQPNPAFAKKRTLPTYFEGEKLGFTPKDKDVGFLTAAHISAFNKAVASREYIKSLFEGKAEDGRPLATVSRASAVEVPGADPRRDAGAYLIKPNIKKNENDLDYQPFDHPALRKWRWAGTNPDSGKPTLVQGDALLHPDIYQHVKNNLSRSAFQTWTVKALGSEFQPGRLMLNASRQIKDVILSLSGFHQLTEATRAAEHRQFPVSMPELDLEDPDQRFAVDHGLMVAEYGGLDAFSEGVASGGVITKIPLIGPAYDVYRNYLFKSYIPRLKMAVFQKALARNQKTYPDLSRDQAGMLTADQVNATFGGLNYKALGRNPTVQDVLRLTLLAPDFLESTFRSEGQGAKGYGREQLTAIVLGAAVLYTALRLLNELTDGKPHWDKPFSLVVNGKEFSIRTRAADLLRMIENSREFVYGRLSPLARTGIEQLLGRDKQGHKSNLLGEAKEGLGEMAHGAKEALKGNLEGGFEAARGLGKATGQNVPIPLQPFTSDRGDQSTAEKIVESMLKMVGVNVKKFHSAAEEEAYKISQDKGATGEFTQEQRDRYYARQRALDGLRKGDSKALEEALEKGLIRPNEIRTMIHRSMGSPLYDRVIGFSYPETKRVYDKAVADHDEKAQQELFPLLMEKYENEIKRGQFNDEAPSNEETPALSLQ